MGVNFEGSNKFLRYAHPLIPTTLDGSNLPRAWGIFIKCYQAVGPISPSVSNPFHLNTNVPSTQLAYSMQRSSLGVPRLSLVYSHDVPSGNPTHQINQSFIAFESITYPQDAIFIDFSGGLNCILRLYEASLDTRPEAGGVYPIGAPYGMLNATLQSTEHTFHASEIVVINRPFTANDKAKLSKFYGDEIVPPLQHFNGGEILFYHKLLNRPGHPYRIGGVEPTFQGFTFADLDSQTFQSGYQDQFVDNFGQYIPDATIQEPTEYIINIEHSLIFDDGSNDLGSPEFQDTIRIVDALGQNIRYKTWTDFLTFVGDITSNIKICNILHTLWIVEQWVKENDDLTVSMKEELLRIVCELSANVDVQRSVNHELTFASEFEAYKKNIVNEVDYGNAN